MQHSGHMFPSQSVNDVVNQSSRNSILCGKRALKTVCPPVTFSNLFHFGFGELCLPMQFTFGKSLPSLARHILHVLLVRPQKKMCGIYARGVVAFMTALQSFRNFSFGVFPRKTMGHAARRTGNTFRNSFWKLNKQAVPVIRFPPSPFPTAIRSFFVHFFPESNGWRFGFIHTEWGT